jgi:hypothetical protein
MVINDPGGLVNNPHAIGAIVLTLQGVTCVAAIAGVAYTLGALTPEAVALGVPACVPFLMGVLNRLIAAQP